MATLQAPWLALMGWPAWAVLVAIICPTMYLKLDTGTGTCPMLAWQLMQFIGWAHTQKIKETKNDIHLGLVINLIKYSIPFQTGPSWGKGLPKTMLFRLNASREVLDDREGVDGLTMRLADENTPGKTNIKTPNNLNSWNEIPLPNHHFCGHMVHIIFRGLQFKTLWFYVTIREWTQASCRIGGWQKYDPPTAAILLQYLETSQLSVLSIQVRFLISVHKEGVENVEIGNIQRTQCSQALDWQSKVSNHPSKRNRKHTL